MPAAAHAATVQCEHGCQTAEAPAPTGQGRGQEQGQGQGQGQGLVGMGDAMSLAKQKANNSVGMTTDECSMLKDVMQSTVQEEDDNELTDDSDVEIYV